MWLCLLEVLFGYWNTDLVLALVLKILKYKELICEIIFKTTSHQNFFIHTYQSIDQAAFSVFEHFYSCTEMTQILSIYFKMMCRMTRESPLSYQITNIINRMRWWYLIAFSYNWHLTKNMTHTQLYRMWFRASIMSADICHNLPLTNVRERQIKKQHPWGEHKEMSRERGWLRERLL